MERNLIILAYCFMWVFTAVIFGLAVHYIFSDSPNYREGIECMAYVVFSIYLNLLFKKEHKL